MKPFWCLFFILQVFIQYLGYWHFGKNDPVPALMILGYLNAIILGFTFPWLFEKKIPGSFILPLLMVFLCWNPVFGRKNETSLFDHAMTRFLDYDSTRLTGLVGGIESSIGSTIYMFLTGLTFAVTVFITASLFGFGFDGIDRGGRAFFRKAYATIRKWEKDIAEEYKQSPPKP